MTWNYRIVRYRSGNGYGLHEVFYDADGTPRSMTKEAIRFGAEAGDDAVAEISHALKMALRDAEYRPILDEATAWSVDEKCPGP